MDQRGCSIMHWDSGASRLLGSSWLHVGGKRASFECHRRVDVKHVAFGIQGPDDLWDLLAEYGFIG